MWFQNIFNGKQKPRAKGKKPGQPGNRVYPGLPDQTLRQLDRLSLNTGALMLKAQGGVRSSPQRRASTEFLDHRQYVAGDDIRFVDWKASARQEHVFIKQGESPKAAMVYLVLDCSASMAWGTPPKASAALALAHALGYLALSQSDRLILVPGSTNQALPPGPLWGKGQAPLLGTYLRQVRSGGQFQIEHAAAEVQQRKQSAGGLVLILSDLLGEGDLGRALDILTAPQRKVVVLHLLHPQELRPDLHGDLEMVDIETRHKKRYTITSKALEAYQRRVEAWQADIVRNCQEHKITYVHIPTDASLEKDVLPELIRAQVVIRP
ncbi:MAG: DUF58 domain-containing protein [Chloroflexi bacterium]|nr:DUF58 domain-containing protein [Chloroflexota bacterium]